jgi:hypothetical protein
MVSFEKEASSLISSPKDRAFKGVARSWQIFATTNFVTNSSCGMRFVFQNTNYAGIWRELRKRPNKYC